MQDKFWVFDWLEENQITSLAEAAEFLPKYRVLDNLTARAQAAHEKGSGVSRSDHSIVAGTGIDLSGGHSICPGLECMRAQVDQLFKRVWYYFDEIVVRDAFTPALLHPNKKSEGIIEFLLTHLAPLLYLREIGAEQLVQFTPKHFCSDWEKHAQEVGLSEALARRSCVRNDLRKNATFVFEEDEQGDPVFSMGGEELHNTSISISPKKYPGLDEEGLKCVLLDYAIQEHLLELTADVMAARQLKLPLGASTGLHGMLLSARRPPIPTDVLLKLELPVLDGVSTKSLIEIRNRERESFMKFRNSLRIAASERLKASASGDPRSIAEEIRLDVIEPALDGIRQRLLSSEKGLAKKTGVAVFLGALVTTVGVLCGLPPTTALQGGSVLTITATGIAAQKHIDEQQQTSLDDMYFLWRASEHSHE